MSRFREGGNGWPIAFAFFHCQRKINEIVSRGIASRVLYSFGAKTLAVVTSGGANGERFEKLLAKAG